jgi:hypothetical protein
VRYTILIFIFLTGGAIGSLRAQGYWVPFVTSIDSSPPLRGQFLNEQYGFVATKKGEYRTTDGGITWTIIPNFPSYNRYFYFLNPQNIFLDGALESNDSGLTWKKLNQSAPSGNIYIKDGIFYDATGFLSKDHGKTWKQINFFPLGEAIVGNLDNGIAMWGGSGYKTGVTSYSIDSGRNWLQGQSGVESDFGYAIPFTFTYFRAGGDGNDAIQRTTDGGQTWDIVYGPVNRIYLSDGIGGNGCIVYAQTMRSSGSDPEGLLRSTDQGNTWTGIGGPIGNDDQPICGIASRGATCIAMTYRFGSSPDTIWKYTDPTILQPFTSSTQIENFFPDTIYLTQCDSLLLKIQTSFRGCDFIRFHNLEIANLNSKHYKVFFNKDKILRDGIKDTSSVKLLPDTAGTYHLFIHITLSGTDWSGIDTVFPLILIVKPNPAVLNISKQILDFGTKPLCYSPSQDTIILSNPGCYSTIISYIRWEPDSVVNSDFSFSNGFPYILKRDQLNDKIVVDFHPQSPGIKKWDLIIESTVGNDTIPVYANVLPDTRTITTSSSPLQCPLCDSIDGFLRLYNPNCHDMSLDLLSLANPYRLLLTQLPIRLPYEDSITIPIRYFPVHRGVNSIIVNATLRYFEPSDTTIFDTTVTLTGFATHGLSSYSLSSNSAIFDTLHICDSVNRRIVLYSTGCDSLPLQSISISGDSDFTYSVSNTEYSSLATGDSIVLNVSLNPRSIGNKSAAITIKMQDSTLVTIPLNGIVIRPLKLLYSDRSGTLDFGLHLICESNDTIITLTNPSCDTVHISGIGLRGSGFGVTDTFPINIPPGKSRAIDVKTILDTTGGQISNTDTLTVTSDADNSISPISFTLFYIYPYPVHLWVDADRTPQPDASTWIVKLKSFKNDLSAVNQIDFTLDYNTDLLGFLQKRSSVQSTDGKTFHLSGGIIPAADSSIAQIAFQVFLTTDTSTTLAFKNISLNASDPNFMGCAAYPLATGIDFNYLNVCGDPSIRTFMLGKPINMTIRPNPVQDEIIVDLQTILNSDASIEIFNILGVKVFSLVQNLSEGVNSINLNTKNLPAGVYIVRLTSSNSVVSQNFLKVK